MASFQTPAAIFLAALICGNGFAARAQAPVTASQPPMPFVDPQDEAPIGSLSAASSRPQSEGIMRVSYETDASLPEATPVTPAAQDITPVAQDNWVAPAAPAPLTQSPVAESTGWDGHWIFGADYLFTRPHFSEATAFVRGTQTASSFNATAQDLDFQYNSSFRAFAGYQFEGTDTQLRFTYTRFNNYVEESAGNFSPGHFAVDPFGNVAGVAVVIDPSSAQFGQPLVGGDHIQASAQVTANIFDLDVIKPILWVCGGCEFKYTAGVRIAQIHQFYQSIVSESGSFFGGGIWGADFVGAGPRVGLQSERYFGACRQFSLFANAAGSLLVGQYDTNFGQSTTGPTFQATQDTNEIRVLPVAEAEFGAGWSPRPWLNVSGGWLFQTWFDLGGSGGSFGGFYTVTDNSNIMAFEGFFLRAQVTF
jgi:hypothetical protein